jgi:hypothetical protein
MKPDAKKPQHCAIYTRVSTEIGLEQGLTPFMLSARPRRPTSRARLMRAGNRSGITMTTAASPAAAWTAPACRSCSPTYGSAGSTLWSSIRSIA